MRDIRHHASSDGARVAYRFAPGAGPATVFLPGYMSDMTGSKAQALLGHCARRGRPGLLLDYTGCGLSDGDFAEGTLSRWRGEVAALIDALRLDRVVLVGSSMGGWLMLLVALAMPERVAGLVGIAAAPDFTEWGVSDDQRARLARGELVLEPNRDGLDPTPIHPGFWADAQALRLLGASIPLDCPARLLHGQRDEDVPVEIALRLAAALRSDDVQVTLVKGGDHRLSREQDIALLLRTLDALATGAG